MIRQGGRRQGPSCSGQALASRPHTARRPLSPPARLQGWSSLPAPLLEQIFQVVVDQYDAPRELLAAWQPLALVCRAWRAALLTTPVGLELKAPAHVGPAALRWLARTQVEVSPARCSEALA